MFSSNTPSVVFEYRRRYLWNRTHFRPSWGARSTLGGRSLSTQLRLVRTCERSLLVIVFDAGGDGARLSEGGERASVQVQEGQAAGREREGRVGLAHLAHRHRQGARAPALERWRRQVAPLRRRHRDPYKSCPRFRFKKKALSSRAPPGKRAALWPHEYMFVCERDLCATESLKLSSTRTRVRRPERPPAVQRVGGRGRGRDRA